MFDFLLAIFLLLLAIRFVLFVIDNALYALVLVVCKILGKDPDKLFPEGQPNYKFAPRESITGTKGSSLFEGNVPCAEEVARRNSPANAKFSPLASEHLAELRAARGVYTS